MIRIKCIIFSKAIPQSKSIIDKAMEDNIVSFAKYNDYCIIARYGTNKRKLKKILEKL